MGKSCVSSAACGGKKTRHCSAPAGETAFRQQQPDRKFTLDIDRFFFFVEIPNKVFYFSSLMI